MATQSTIPAVDRTTESPAIHDDTTHNEPADPIPSGIMATAKQSFKDLFIWKQRTEIIDQYGGARYEWQAAPPVQNPIKLFMQLSAKQWLFFLVGLFCWMADAFDFHALSIQTKKLADYYGQSKTSITTAITLTLLLRSVVCILHIYTQADRQLIIP